MMLVFMCVLILNCFLAFSSAQETRYNYTNLYLGPYKHIYPPANIAEDPGSCTPGGGVICPLFIAIMFSFGGSFTSSGVIPSMQIAIDQMNNDTSFLPGYRLHLIVKDSRCDRTISLKNFHVHLLQPPTKIGVIGSGCSTATEATSEVGPFYNLTHISCLSSSTSLADRSRFSRHFQISASEINLAPGFFGIIKEFGWNRVGILTQDENLFTVTMDKLKSLLRDFEMVEVKERRFDTSDGIITLGENPFDSGARVFILSMFTSFAREILCKAAQYRMVYPRALFMVVGWYPPQWWEGTAEEQMDLEARYGCTVADRENIMDFVLAPRKAGRRFTDASRVADSGINGSQIESLYDQYRESTSLLAPWISFYQQCYDATWTLGLALKRTLNQINTNATLRAKLAEYTTNADVNTFGLQHFTYNNPEFLELMFNTLHGLQFEGIVGPIQFDENGLRIVSTVDLTRYRRQNGVFIYSKVADIMRGTASEGDTTVVYLPGYSISQVFPRGVPPDGIPNEEDVGVILGISILFIALSSIGIIFSLLGMCLHFAFRKKTVIRLSSPNLNLLIGVGAIILYIDIIVTVLPGATQIVRSVVCNLTPWLTGLGYSLCYGTVLAKMTRVYYIFDNPSQRRKKPLQDWMLALGVGLLVAIDFIILVVYTAIEYVHGELEAVRISNKEDPEMLIGEREEVTRYFSHVCEGQGRSITIGVLYGYKMLPQIVALIFAFSIRKIKIKGLDDAKYIAFAVYITSLVTAIVIVISYTLDTYINLFAGIFSAGFFIGTTSILLLVLLPPLIEHFQDPEGTKVFPGGTMDSSTDNATMVPSHRQAGNVLSGRPTNSETTQVEGLKKKIVDLERKLESKSKFDYIRKKSVDLSSVEEQSPSNSQPTSQAKIDSYVRKQSMDLSPVSEQSSLTISKTATPDAYGRTDDLQVTDEPKVSDGLQVTDEPKVSDGLQVTDQSQVTGESESIPTVKPRESIPTGEPRESGRNGEPQESIPTGEPRESLPTGEPRESIPTGEPQESIPTGPPRESYMTGEAIPTGELQESTMTVEPQVNE